MFVPERDVTTGGWIKRHNEELHKSAVGIATGCGLNG
jgi:hypothetical protein